MTYKTITCDYCVSDTFIYQPAQPTYQVSILATGGVVLEATDWSEAYDQPDDVRCQNCGLHPSRVQLDPDYNIFDVDPKFKIEIRRTCDLE